MDARIIAAVERNGLKRHARDILVSCYDAIADGSVVSATQLIDHLGPFAEDDRILPIIQRSFRLIKQVHWGIFRNLDPQTHPELWKALTTSSRPVDGVADLKRNVVVPNLYCGLMDIRSYTAFCRDNRHNTSMLRTLDEFIHHDIRDVANRNRCIAFRSAGDAIVVIGSSAANMIRTCLGIIDGFSRKRAFKSTSLSNGRNGKSLYLQDFHISGGIAGGLRYGSIVITDDGDVSGTIVNTAARLQSFAGRMSPNSSKVMITAHVHAGYRKGESYTGGTIDGLDFFDYDRVSFKGTSVKVYEILYGVEDHRKLAYQQQYSELARAMSANAWNDSLVPNAVSLVADVLQTIDAARISVEVGRGRAAYSGPQLLALCEEAIRIFRVEGNRRTVSVHLNAIGSLLQRVAGFDPIVLERFLSIARLFDRLTYEFESQQYEKIMENQVGLFSTRERSLIDGAAQLEQLRNALIERGKNDTRVYASASLWKKIVADHNDSMDMDIYSGKR